MAETFLQRTKALQAERAFMQFRTRFPAPATLVAAGPEAARQFTDIVGLHWRGPLLYETACRVAEAGGSPPETETELVRLPGVGPYAAAAWLSLHRNRRAVIVDNNVARWLSRMTGHAYDAETRRKRWVRDLADQLTPARTFRDYNYAVLDFTMRICRPRAPLCPECPVRADCAYGLSHGSDS